MKRDWWAVAVVLTYLVLFVGLGYVAIVIVGWPSARHAAAWQTWATVLAGAVVAWYTWETRELRRAAREQTDAALRQVDAALRQTDVQLRPLVVLELWGPSFTLRNLGGIAALNVCVDDVPISMAPDRIEVRFPWPLPVLPAGGWWGVAVESWKNGALIPGDPFSAHLLAPVATQRLQVTVHYENLEGHAYHVTETVAPGSVHISAVN